MSSVLFICLMLWLPLQASTVRLTEIEVTAAKEISDYSFSSSHVFRTHELDSQVLGTLSSVLDDDPSLVANQNGGPGGRVSYFIRGTESRHLAFTIDGMKINDPSNTDRQFDAAFFTLPFLSNVQLHKGPQAVLYGSDALGGMVELTTRKGEDAPETRLGVRGGSFETTETYVSSDWSKGKHRGTLTANRFLSEGISRLNEKRFMAKEADAAEMTQLSSSSRHQWSAQSSTDVLFSYLRGFNELDGAQDDNSFDESTNDHYVLQQRTELKISKASALSLRNGLSRHQRWIDTLLRGEEAYTGNLLQQELLHHYQASNLRVLSGVATEHEDFNLSGSRSRRLDLHSVFLQSAFQLERLKFQAGGRIEEHTRYGTFYTGSAGAGLRLQRSLFSLQFSQGFKAPSLYHLYGPYANGALVPEVNHAWEGRGTFFIDEGEFSAALFQNRLSNLITYDFAQQRFFNQGRFIAEGVELTGRRRWDSVEVSGGFVHQKFRHEQEEVLRRPQNNLHGGIALYPNDVSEVALKGRWFSARKDRGTVETVKLNSFETFDVGAKYFFASRDMDLGIQILNVLNREYEELYGFSVLPRSVFAHSSIRF